MAEKITRATIERDYGDSIVSILEDDGWVDVRLKDRTLISFCGKWYSDEEREEMKNESGE